MGLLILFEGLADTDLEKFNYRIYIINKLLINYLHRS